MIRLLGPILAFVLVAARGGLAQPADVDARLVSIEAKGKSLSEVFSELAAQTQARITLQGGEKRTVTLSLTDIPFSQCMASLCDVFSLIARWREDTLVVAPLEEVVGEAVRELGAGRGAALAELEALATGRKTMYGSAELRGKLAAALRQLQQQKTLTLGGEGASAARASDNEVAAAASAVRTLLRQGDLQNALLLWERALRGQWSWDAAVASAELFMALHYRGAPQAAAVWAQSFDLNTALLLLGEGWRQRAYRDALHLARLNMRYALATGRMAEARALQTAMRQYLDSPRVIAVTCAVDSEAVSDPRCESKVRARIAKCSEVFQQFFGIELSIVEIIRWNPPSDNDFDRQYMALKAALGTRRPELAIGFILEVLRGHPSDLDPSRTHLWIGYGCPHNGAYLLLRDFAFAYEQGGQSAELTMAAGTVTETLIHELGHMFGALHSEDERSVMRAVSRPEPALAFDALNAQIIMRRKWQDLAQGVESLDEPELLGLCDDYRLMARLSSVPNGALEEEARVHLALARLYRQRNAWQQAAAELGEVLAIGVPEEVVVQAQRMLAQE